MSTIKALLFDFDGLILDTETPKFEAWREIYRENGADLALEEWAVCLGTSDQAFDAVERLQILTGKTFERDRIDADFNKRTAERLNQAGPLPGVTALIEHASRTGLALGLASSSPRNWVLGYLHRLMMAAYFDCILCREDVLKVKPEPDLYLLLMQRLRVTPESSVAFEDSPNGITSARQAGIFCVGVPNALSRFLDIRHADWILPSLAALPPGEFLAEIQARRGD